MDSVGEMLVLRAPFQPLKYLDLARVMSSFFSSGCLKKLIVCKSSCLPVPGTYGGLRQKLVLSILDGFLRDAVVLDIEESSVNSCLVELRSKSLPVLELARVEPCQVDDRDLVWSTVARWDIQNISKDRSDRKSTRLNSSHWE